MHKEPSTLYMVSDHIRGTPGNAGVVVSRFCPYRRTSSRPSCHEEGASHLNPQPQRIEQWIGRGND